MSETNFGAPTPQFGTAEYAAKPGTDVCKSCKQAITGLYYRVNGSLACDRCVNQLKDQLPKDTHSAFVRGLAFGIGGAVIGLILYSAFTIITGIVIGYVSLAVGWIIAKAFKMGSRGIGGRRYQIAAAALTYAAVSLAAVPIYFSAISKEQARKPARTQTAPAPVSPDNCSSPSDADIASGSVPLEKPKVSLGSALGLLLLIGLASPFLALENPVGGAIGLVILFVGMNIAWKLTAGPKVEILGPFVAVASSPPPTPA
jgi:predicted lipid-binding transport protein (Tim44 family)